MVTFDIRTFIVYILILQWLPQLGDASYYAKTITYLRRHWTTKVEHTFEYTRYYKEVANFGVTRRRCEKATPYVHYVRTLVHDSRYPWHWEAGPTDIPSITTWGYFLSEFIFYNERETGNDTEHAQLVAVIPTHPTYYTFTQILPIFFGLVPFVYVLGGIVLPFVGKVGVHIILYTYGFIFHRRHRRFWRAFFLHIELSRRRIHRISDPIAVDHHMLEFQYLIPFPFRDTESEGEPIEVINFQDTINVWIEDDSDGQIDQTKLYSLLYKKDGNPIMEKINIYHGIRINLRKEREYRNDVWEHLEELRLRGFDRRRHDIKRPPKKKKPKKPPKPRQRVKSILGQQFDRLKKEKNPNITASMLLRRLSPIQEPEPMPKRSSSDGEEDIKNILSRII